METSGTPVREEVHLSRRMCRWMAGLDTGIWGASLFLAWLIFFSALSRDFWWARLNVVGAFFFGDDVFHMGLSWATVAGAALLVLLYSAVGAAMAQLAFTRGFIRNLFLGLILGTAWHIVAQRYLWRSIHPFAPAFFPSLGMLPGHLLFGLTLGRFARRFRAIAVAYGDAAWVAHEWPAAASSFSASDAGPGEDALESPPVILHEAEPAIVGPSVEERATSAMEPSNAAEPSLPRPATPVAPALPTDPTTPSDSATPAGPPPVSESQDPPVLPPLTLDDPSASAELPAGVSGIEPMPAEEGTLEPLSASAAPVRPTDLTASALPAASVESALPGDLAAPVESASPVDPASSDAPSSPAGAGSTPHQDPPAHGPNAALPPSAVPPLPPTVPSTETSTPDPSIPSPSDAPKSSSFSEPTASPVPPTKDGQNK